jgi:hypothetical protein
MLQMLNLPDWLPWWVPLVLLLPTLLWALSFLFMPFSVFGVKSRLEVIETRLEEIQTELRHLAQRLHSGGTPGSVPGADYDDMFPPRMPEPRASDRMQSRPPIPPARHELYNVQDSVPPGEPVLEDRQPPSPSARPMRRSEPPLARPARSEPRLDWRR